MCPSNSHHTRGVFIHAFVEKSGKNRWRVRYPKDDGGFGTISGFTSKTAAENKAAEIEADQRRGHFLDPDGGKLTLAEWSVAWFDALDVAATTEAQYRSLVRNHILARWSDTRLDAISGLAVHTWGKKLVGRCSAFRFPAGSSGRCSGT